MDDNFKTLSNSTGFTEVVKSEFINTAYKSIGPKINQPQKLNDQLGLVKGEKIEFKSLIKEISQNL
jgi:hypothetical protein